MQPITSSQILLKKIHDEYEKSNEKQQWRVLAGMDHKNRMDTFVFGDKNLWQVKSEMIGKNETISVGIKVEHSDDDLRKYQKHGAPIPFGMASPQPNNGAIILSGVQQYSSDATYKLCRDHISNSQSKLNDKLNGELNTLLDSNEIFRRKYRQFKDEQNRSYL